MRGTGNRKLAKKCPSNSASDSSHHLLPVHPSRAQVSAEMQALALKTQTPFLEGTLPHMKQDGFLYRSLADSRDQRQNAVRPALFLFQHPREHERVHLYLTVPLQRGCNTWTALRGQREGRTNFMQWHTEGTETLCCCPTSVSGPLRFNSKEKICAAAP